MIFNGRVIDRSLNAAHEGGHYKMTQSAFISENAYGRFANSKEWSGSVGNGMWDQNHRYAQEYILKDPVNIRYYKQYSPELQGYMRELQKNAIESYNASIKTFGERLDYYNYLGYKHSIPTSTYVY